MTIAKICKWEVWKNPRQENPPVAVFFIHVLFVSSMLKRIGKKKKKKTPCKLQNKSSLLVKGGEFKRGRAWEGGRKEILNGILFSELYQLANISYKRKKEGRNSMH